MIQLQNITCDIGRRRLFDSIEWIIHPNRKMALIGPNGAGKTTLLRILTGQIQPDSGEIRFPKDTSVGFLPQEEIVIDKGTLLEAVLQNQKEVTALETKIQSLHHELDGHVNPDNALLDKLGRLENHYQAIGGYEMEHQAKRILSGLGFKESDFTRPVNEFSGGWRMRSYLGSILLKNPDVLLLDEPTNHLDLPSLEWLESYLQKFSGNIIIVSHDRFFIDRLVTDIYELDRGQLTHYSGNYHHYEAQKEKDKELLEKQYKSQQDYIKQQRAFIDRFRYKATKAAQVQSRIKQIEKIDRIELADEKHNWSFNITVQEQSYKDVLQIKNVYFRYDKDWIFEDINFDLYRQERIALVGPNGVGKTTLTRLIHQDLTPQKGSVLLGQKVQIGYYSQHQIDALNLENTIWDEVNQFAFASAAQHIRNMLGIFQFSGDDVHKKISVLSGGEKARVSLAKILLSSANFLIMDEPTNHLDMRSKEALEQALQNYEGTLILISHDRYFLDKLIHRVIEIKDRKLYVYEGNYNDYLKKREEVKAAEMLATTSGNNQSQSKKSKDQKRQEAELRNRLNKIKRPVEQKIKKAENKIAALEAEQKTLEKELANPKTYENNANMLKLQQAYTDINETLEKQYADWEGLQEALETITTQFNEDS